MKKSIWRFIKLFVLRKSCFEFSASSCLKHLFEIVRLSYVKLLLIHKELNLWRGIFILVPSILGETRCVVKFILKV